MICSPRPCRSTKIAAIDNISAKVASWLKQACVIFLVWSGQHIFHQFSVEDEPRRELNRWWRLNINSYGDLDFIDWEMSIVLSSDKVRAKKSKSGMDAVISEGGGRGGFF